jgi:hypothetical protein
MIQIAVLLFLFLLYAGSERIFIFEGLKNYNPLVKDGKVYGINTIKNTTRLIVELQNEEYNLGALKSDKSLGIIENVLNFKCTDPLFCNNGPDGDYGFINLYKYGFIDISK